MADWKQITARIRRARTSKDPAGQLAALYEKTHDAMVAFELAKYFESTTQNADAAKWYGTAAERFRRADWKTKAQEAAVRLGGDPGNGAGAEATEANGNVELTASSASLPSVLVMPEPSSSIEQGASTFAGAGESPVVSSEVEEDEDDSIGNRLPGSESPSRAAKSSGPESEDKRRRRRGRRGGRNRRKTGVGPQPVESSSRAGSTPINSTRRSGPPPPPPTIVETPAAADAPVPIRRTMPPLPIEPIPEGAGPNPRGRYGDPGLSSRMSALEMQFRRLLTCEAVKLDEANNAPAGPGVLVLSDSDLTSYYYVEPCQTLRIAVANLLRGNASKRGSESISKQLAEHLGITEARVPKYLAEHCVVRWLQLDEGASHFAHFVIAVLRPVLNE
jgi:hypothetical protein